MIEDESRDRRSRLRREFTIRRDAAWIDVTLVAVIVAASLFNLLLGPLTPMLILASAGAYVVLRWDRIVFILRDGWMLLLLPLVAVLSASWSSVPDSTAYYSLLYLLTVGVGLVIGRGMVPGKNLTGIFVAFAIYTVLSFASFRWTPWGGPGGQAFVGLSQSKNNAGDMAGVGLLVTICIASSYLSRRRLMQAGTVLLLIPIYLFIMWFSRATGALISTAAITLCMFCLLLARSVPVQARAALTVFLIALILGLIATQSFWLPPIFDAVLENSGKDAGLTGRAELWAYADGLIEKRPWFGIGFNAFWLENNFEAEAIWREMGVRSKQGFHFHNTYREILVHLGYFGMAIFAVVVLLGSVLLLVKTILRPTHERIFALSLAMFYAMKLPFELVAFAPMHFSVLMFFAAMAIGFRRDPVT